MVGLAIVGVLAGLASKLAPIDHEPTKKAGGGSKGPATAEQYRSDAYDCKPSCYEKQPTPEGSAPKVKFCGYYSYMVEQAKLGANKWGPTELGPTTGTVGFVPGCVFPKAKKNRFPAVVADVKKALKAKAGEAVFIPDEEDWEPQHNALGLVKSRMLSLRFYSKNVEDYDRCRAGNPQAKCEFFGDYLAKTFNIASYRTTEATKLAGGKDAAGCRVAAWDAVRQVRTLPAVRKKDGKYDPTSMYATRYDGQLTGEELFKKAAELEKRALDAFHKCGGSGDPPLESNDIQY
jgi:hypothetical protein